MKQQLSLLLTAILLSTNFVNGASSYSSGGSKSFSNSSSSSSNSSKGSSWGSSTNTTTSNNNNNSSKSWNSSKSTATNSSSSASSALKNKQVASVPQKSRQDYVKEFKQQNASKYTNKFTTEPSTRPSYIPPTTIVNNHSYNVYYNSSYGGYGYMNALGTFIMYDALEHAAHSHYDSYVATQPIYVEEAGFWTICLHFIEVMILLVLFFGLLFVVFGRNY